MVPPTAQKKGPNVSTPRTPYTNFLRHFIGDFLRMLYLHGHTHTLVEFASAMDEVFKQVHKEFDFKFEVSYDQWVSRKDQWDKDFDIKNGGPPKEICDGLFQYPTVLECHEGKIRARARQPGRWLVSDINSKSITENQPPPFGEQPSDIHLKEQGPVHDQTEYPWIAGGSLSNAHEISIIHRPTYSEPFTQVLVDASLPLPSPGPAGDTTTPFTRYFGPHGNLTITPSNSRSAGTNEWDVVDHTMSYGHPISTYPTLPVQPPRSLQDLRGGRNTPTQPDPRSTSVSAAQGQDHHSYPQTRPSA